MNQSAAAENWRNLVAGKSTAIRSANRHAGRTDIRGLHLPKPESSKKTRISGFNITPLTGLTEIRGAKWSAIDFSNSVLPSLRIFDSSLNDCVFEGAKLADLRVWGVSFRDVNFTRTDLRKAAIGAFHNNKLNIYENADFSFADLRGTSYQVAKFVGCKFSNTRLTKVDFGGSIFVDCVFEGEMREVLFYDHAFKVENAPQNQMQSIDFSRANLRWCAFRGLNLDKVIFPASDDHIVVTDYPMMIDHLLGLFSERIGPGWKALCAVLVDSRKWLGPQQKLGYFNTNDLFDLLGAPDTAEVVDEIRRFAR